MGLLELLGIKVPEPDMELYQEAKKESKELEERHIKPEEVKGGVFSPEHLKWVR